MVVVNHVKPYILFIAETMVSDDGRTLKQVGFDNFWKVPPIGKKGGLVLA